jgi:hypothetical protein
MDVLGQAIGPETSVGNYDYVSRNNTNEPSSNLPLGVSLKWRAVEGVFLQY